MYEIFEHTADLGLRIRAPGLKELFEEAARALFSVMVVNFDDVRLVDEVTFQVAGSEHDELLRDWLAELLYAFHSVCTLACPFQRFFLAAYLNYSLFYVFFIYILNQVFSQ